MLKTTYNPFSRDIFAKIVVEDMKRMVMVLIVFAFSVRVYAQTEGEVAAVLRVLGQLSIEEADAEDVDRLLQFIDNPVVLDMKGIERLESNGLLSPYQSASLKDYLSRHGMVMSLAELSSVDGFGGNSAGCLSPFITFQDMRNKKDAHEVDGKMDIKGAFRLAGDNSSEEWNYGLRGNISLFGNVDMSFSASRSYDAPGGYPSAFGGTLMYSNRFGKIIVGDFNARFGQGICLWNTAMFSSLTSPSSFMKKPSGLSTSYSYTGSSALTGAAVELLAGRWKFSALTSFPQIKSSGTEGLSVDPAVNVTRYFPFGHVSMTHYMSFSNVVDSNFRIPKMRSSVDASICVRGINIFSETVADWVSMKPSFVAGVESGVGERLTLASLVRYLPSSNEHGLAFSGEVRLKKHEGVFSTDLLYDPRQNDGARRIQFKGQCRWRWNMSESIWTELRLTERIRTWGNPFRTDARIDLHYSGESWLASLRFNVLACINTGLLGYAEAGYKFGRLLKIYFRQGLFRIDDWEDRIYVYERDAPGNFNVPAFYGRGLWSSIYLTSKFARWGSMYLKASYIAYPFMQEKKKPGKAELKLQLSLQL